MAASATIRERRGALVALTAEDGHTGWGDCAPLPSSGAARHERVLAVLAELAGLLPGAVAARAVAQAEALSCPPEVRWALETALCDLAARRRQVPLAVFLGAPEAGSVAVNAALGPLDEGCAERAADALARGFRVAKVKVGVAEPEIELERLRAVDEAVGGRLTLRLDANRAFREPVARRFLAGCARLPVEAVEEPLAAPTAAALAALQARLPFAVAVDESLPELGLEALLAAGGVRRLVVKPARLGGVAATCELAARARAAGLELVLTSVVDSTIGVTAAAHLAAALAPELAHGLATLDWLAADVAPSPPLVAGRLLLGEGPGLGRAPGGEPAQEQPVGLAGGEPGQGRDPHRRPRSQRR